MRAIAALPTSWTRTVSTLSPNRKRHIARVVIWSTAAAAVVVELGYLAAVQLA